MVTRRNRKRNTSKFPQPDEGQLSLPFDELDKLSTDVNETAAQVDRILADVTRRLAKMHEAAVVKLNEFADALSDDNLGEDDRKTLLRFMNEDADEGDIVLALEECLVAIVGDGSPRANAAKAGVRVVKRGAEPTFHFVNAGRRGAELGLMLPFHRYVQALNKDTRRKPVCELVIDGLAWRRSDPNFVRADAVQRLIVSVSKRLERKR